MKMGKVSNGVIVFLIWVGVVIAMVLVKVFIVK